MTFSALKAALDNFKVITEEDWQMLEEGRTLRGGREILE
jgi:hypothetical protein